MYAADLGGCRGFDGGGDCADIFFFFLIFLFRVGRFGGELQGGGVLAGCPGGEGCFFFCFGRQLVPAHKCLSAVVQGEKPGDLLW